MKKKLLTIFLFAFVFALVGAFTACSAPKVDLDSLAAEYPYVVTFDYNGGAESGGATRKVVYCKENSLLPEPGQTTIYGAPAYAGHSLEGYFRGEKNADGEIVWGDEWDFQSDRVTETLTLYARWEDPDYLTVLYRDESGKAIEAASDYTYELLASSGANWNVFNSFRTPTIEGYTFYKFYYDAGYTQEVNFPYDYLENPVENIYARYYTGDWVLADEASDLTNLKSGSNVYLLNDIDMAGVDFEGFPGTYTGEFNGNGHKISNLTAARASGRSSYNMGLFNILKNTANIHDVTFDNISLTVTFNEPTPDGRNNYVGLLAGTVEEGAKINDVTCTGSVTYDKAASKRSIVCNATYGLYGGTDFAAAYPTFVYTGITVNDGSAAGE